MKNEFKRWLQLCITYLSRKCTHIFTRLAISTFILGGIVLQLQASDNIDPREHGTGAILTEQQIQHIQNNWPRILAVRPNKYGAARIQEILNEQDRFSFGAIQIAETGEDEFITNKDLPTAIGFNEVVTMKALALPSKVDNSALACFPPIGDQRTQGSCVGWASTYYQATHEYGLLNGINNKTSSVNIRSPKWTYNMINWGQDGGSVPQFAFELLSQNGAVSFNEFPYDNNYTQWDLNPAHWISALNYRMAPAQFLNIDGPEDIDLVKQILTNGHLVSYVTYAYSWVMTTVKADPAQTQNPYAGQNAISWMNGTEGGHHLTIVGYDDNVWIDVNNNNQVDPGEKGAFLVANSWGSWGNNGFVWVSYDAFYKNSNVANGPSVNRKPMADMLFSVVPKSANYTPKCIAKFSLTLAARNQLNLNAGASGVDQLNPTKKFTSGALTFDGGALAFDGQSAREETGIFALDLTDLLTFDVSQRYYLTTMDITPGYPTTLNTYSLIDLVHNKEVASKQTPLTVDATSTQPYIEYTFANNLPDPGIPTIDITSPTNGTVVSGTVSITANATDNIGVQKVEFYVDSVLQYTDVTVPYLFSLDTTKITNGPHNIKAVVYDTTGNSAQDEISVTVQNNGGDKTPPTVKIIGLANGSVVSGAISVGVTASDNVAVQRVEFYIDNVLVATDATAPYLFSLDMSKYTNGSHTFTAIGVDTSGNSASHTIQVTVQNNDLPQIKIVSPANGATVSGTISVIVNSTNNRKIARVQLFIEKSPIGLDFVAPYHFLVDLSRLTNGQYTLTAVAYDDQGQSYNHSVVINVKNPR